MTPTMRFGFAVAAVIGFALANALPWTLDDGSRNGARVYHLLGRPVPNWLGEVLLYKGGFAIIWLIFLALALWAGNRWWTARRSDRLAPWHCPACGYDCRATPDRCPECGRMANRA